MEDHFKDRSLSIATTGKKQSLLELVVTLEEGNLHFQTSKRHQTRSSSFAFRAGSRFPRRRVKFRARVIDKFHSNLLLPG